MKLVDLAINGLISNTEIKLSGEKDKDLVIGGDKYLAIPNIEKVINVLSRTSGFDLSSDDIIEYIRSNDYIYAFDAVLSMCKPNQCKYLFILLRTKNDPSIKDTYGILFKKLFNCYSDGKLTKVGKCYRESDALCLYPVCEKDPKSMVNMYKMPMIVNSKAISKVDNKNKIVDSEGEQEDVVESSVNVGEYFSNENTLKEGVYRRLMSIIDYTVENEDSFKEEHINCRKCSSEVYGYLNQSLSLSRSTMLRHILCICNHLTLNMDDEYVKRCYSVKDDLVLVNTGILSKYGTFLFMFCKRYKGVLIPHSILKDYSDFEKTSVSDINSLEPINIFYNPDDDEIIRNTKSVNVSLLSVEHIVVARKDRLGEYCNLGSEFIYERVVAEIKKALRISKYNINYFKKLYSFNHKKCAYCIPLRLSNFNDESFIIVLRVENGIFKLKTILKYDSKLKDLLGTSQWYNNIW